MDMRMDLSSQTLDRKSDQIETTSRPFPLKRGSDLKWAELFLIVLPQTTYDAYSFLSINISKKHQ